jgi:hypothetical protein
MPKFIIVDDKGNILRAISLPYDGNLINISDMDDEQFESLARNIHAHKVIDKGNNIIEIVMKDEKP